MTFSDIPAGESVFVDANTLIYHFAGDPNYGPACRDFLQRIENQELRGVTSAHVLGEVSHRIMTLEAINRFGWPVKGIAVRLRKHRSEIPQLQVARQAIATISKLGIDVIATTQQLVELACSLCSQHELLMNDGLVVAVMQMNSLIHLASRDSDFDRVAGIVRYSPVG